MHALIGHGLVKSSVHIHGLLEWFMGSWSFAKAGIGERLSWSNGATFSIYLLHLGRDPLSWECLLHEHSLLGAGSPRLGMGQSPPGSTFTGVRVYPPLGFGYVMDVKRYFGYPMVFLFVCVEKNHNAFPTPNNEFLNSRAMIGTKTPNRITFRAVCLQITAYVAKRGSKG